METWEKELLLVNAIRQAKIEVVEKSVETDLEKARQTKYFKREGSPGHYKYYYTEAEYKEAKGTEKKKDNDSSEITAKIVEFGKSGKMPSDKVIKELAANSVFKNKPENLKVAIQTSIDAHKESEGDISGDFKITLASGPTTRDITISEGEGGFLPVLHDTYKGDRSRVHSTELTYHSTKESAIKQAKEFADKLEKIGYKKIDSGKSEGDTERDKHKQMEEDYHNKKKELNSLDGWSDGFSMKKKEYGKDKNIRVMNIGVQTDFKNSKNHFNVLVGEQDAPKYASNYHRELRQAEDHLREQNFSTAKEAAAAADKFAERFNKMENK